MSALSDKEKDALLKLARSAITSELDPSAKIERPDELSPVLVEKRGCFVTLHKSGNLRGCIGIIEPEKSLLAAVEENALHAAFRDPRFSPLQSDELPEIDIEISMLSVPKALDFKDAEDLKAKLKPGVHGVILAQGLRRATFLPQVWEQLPSPDDFLGHLSLKAGLKRTGWKDEKTTIEVYQAEYFSE